MTTDHKPSRTVKYWFHFIWWQMTVSVSGQSWKEYMDNHKELSK